MRGNLETIVGAMFAGKTSELLKRILWAKHQNKKIIVIKPSLDDRYSNEKIITHNDLVPENIIYSGKQIYLIDWEYADFAHPFSDKLRLFGRNHFCDQKKGDILTALQVIQDNTDKLWLELRKKSYEH